LQQVDTPRNLYDRPANAFVAGFIGSPAMNLLIAPVSGGKAKLGHLEVDVPASAGSSVIVGIRPEGFEPASTGFEVQVEVVEELGIKANGFCSELKIVEIPDDVEWIIEEYDGKEWVAEDHRRWS